MVIADSHDGAGLGRSAFLSQLLSTDPDQHIDLERSAATPFAARMTCRKALADLAPVADRDGHLAVLTATFAVLFQLTPRDTKSPGSPRAGPTEDRKLARVEFFISVTSSGTPGTRFSGRGLPLLAR